MDSKQFFYQFGTFIYTIDSMYDEYIKNNHIKSGVSLWVLYALNDNKPHSQHDLCIEWNFPKSTLNTIIKDFEKEGYVELKPIKGEKREMFVFLTDKGKEFASISLDPLYKREKEIYEKISNPNELIKDIKQLTSLIVERIPK